MPHQCAVYACYETAKKPCSVKFHQFPLHDYETCKRWTEFVKKTRPNFQLPTPSTKICSRHFAIDCYEKILNRITGKSIVRLRKGSYPTILPKLFQQLDSARQSPNTSETSAGNITSSNKPENVCVEKSFNKIAKGTMTEDKIYSTIGTQTQYKPEDSSEIGNEGMGTGTTIDSESKGELEPLDSSNETERDVSNIGACITNTGRNSIVSKSQPMLRNHNDTAILPSSCSDKAMAHVFEEEAVKENNIGKSLIHQLMKDLLNLATKELQLIMNCTSLPLDVLKEYNRLKDIVTKVLNKNDVDEVNKSVEVVHPKPTSPLRKMPEPVKQVKADVDMETSNTTVKQVIKDYTEKFPRITFPVQIEVITDQKNEKVNTKPITQGPLSCKICGKKFPTIISKNATNSLHVCDKCHDKTNNLKRLANNLFKEHGAEASLKKVKSEKTFCVPKFNFGNLVRVEAGEKVYCCGHCSYKTTASRNLQKHVLIHSGRRDHRCVYCDKTFTRSDHLKRHILIHTGEKPYKCSYCNYTCARSCHLNNHLRTHTGPSPFKCYVCGVQFGQPSFLKSHMKVHKDKTKFYCTQCELNFVKITEFHSHMKQHELEKVVA